MTLHVRIPHADYHNATTLLSPEDLRSGLLGPYDVGAQGVVIWGSSTELSNSTFLTVRVAAKHIISPLLYNLIVATKLMFCKLEVLYNGKHTSVYSHDHDV